MTTEEICSTKLTTRELRECVALSVGWNDIHYTNLGTPYGVFKNENSYKTIPNFSLDIKVAWELVDRMVGAGASLSMNNREGLWIVEIGINGRMVHAVSEIPAKAVCVVWLQADAMIAQRKDGAK